MALLHFLTSKKRADAHRSSGKEEAVLPQVLAPPDARSHKSAYPSPFDRPCQAVPEDRPRTYRWTSFLHPAEWWNALKVRRMLRYFRPEKDVDYLVNYIDEAPESRIRVGLSLTAEAANARRRPK